MIFDLQSWVYDRYRSEPRYFITTLYCSIVVKRICGAKSSTYVNVYEHDSLEPMLWENQ